MMELMIIISKDECPQSENSDYIAHRHRRVILDIQVQSFVAARRTEQIAELPLNVTTSINPRIYLSMTKTSKRHHLCLNNEASTILN
jgi:hypothetical protein